jgi:hypothetical protein
MKTMPLRIAIRMIEIPGVLVSEGLKFGCPQPEILHNSH